MAPDEKLTIQRHSADLDHHARDVTFLDQAPAERTCIPDARSWPRGHPCTREIAWFGKKSLSNTSVKYFLQAAGVQFPHARPQCADFRLGEFRHARLTRVNRLSERFSGRAGHPGNAPASIDGESFKLKVFVLSTVEVSTNRGDSTHERYRPPDGIRRSHLQGAAPPWLSS